jgi:flagellin
VTFKAAESFTVTSAAAGGLFSATTTNVSALSSVAAIDLGTQTGSNSALDVIDGALSYVANIRSDLGAIQNRFGSTIANLENVSQNVSAARSRIQDADFAQESSNLARSQILQQAGISILAQANASSQSVLSLLQ